MIGFVNQFLNLISMHHKLHNIVHTVSRVTRSFFEIVDFFSKNVGNIVEKAQNCVKKMKILITKIQFNGFLLLNILDQIFKNFHNCGNFGHTSKQ